MKRDSFAVYLSTIGIFFLASLTTFLGWFPLIGYIFLGSALFVFAWSFFAFKTEPFAVKSNLMYLGGCIVVFSALTLNFLGFLNVIIPVMLTEVSKYSQEFIVGVSLTVIVAPLVEEMCKALPNILMYFSRLVRASGKKLGALDSELTGLRYGIIVGVVFTVVETFLYIFVNLPAAGVHEPIRYLEQMLVRLGAPIHVAGGALTGYGLGKADRFRGTDRRGLRRNFIPSYSIAVLIHASWNGVNIAFEEIFENQIALYASVIALAIVANLVPYRLRVRGSRGSSNLRSCNICGFKFDESLYSSCPYHGFSCVQCNSAIEIDNNFCSKCGSSLLYTCRQCGRLNHQTRVFCSSCGRFSPAQKRLTSTSLILIGVLLMGLGMEIVAAILLFSSLSLAPVTIPVLVYTILVLAGGLMAFRDRFWGWFVTLLFGLTLSASVILIVIPAIELLVGIAVTAHTATRLILMFTILILIGWAAVISAGIRITLTKDQTILVDIAKDDLSSKVQ